jgi:hypothetical protein
MTVNINGTTGVSLLQTGAIAANTINTSMLQANSVNSQIIATGSVNTSQLAANSVTSAQIASGAITSSVLGVVTGANTAITGAPTTQTIVSGIPAGVRRLTIMIRPADCSAGSFIIQLGTASGFITSGYVGGMQYGSSASYYPWSNGAIITGGGYGIVTWHLMDATEHIWAMSNPVGLAAGTIYSSSGTVKLSSALTQARFNSSGGAGTITGAFSYSYE